MKKTYIICLFLFIGVCVYAGAYFYTRVSMGQEKYIEQFVLREEESTVEMTSAAYEAAVNNQLICNLTKFVEEEYNADTGEMTEKKINTPVELLGYSRDKLIIYMKQYMKSPGTEDAKKGLIAFELVSFSRDKVVWRKTYCKTTEDARFYGRAENGYVTIYLNDKITLYDYTNIRIEKLPSNLQEKLEEGIEFQTFEELYDFLETFTS